MRETLRHRPFRLLFLAQCASFLGDAIFIIAIAFAVIEISGSAAVLGGVLASGSALLVASFLVSGVWADRLPRVRVMVVSDVIRLGTQGTLAVLLLTDRATIPLLVVLYGIYSIAMAFFTPARTGLTPQLLQPHQLVSGNALMATAENVMWMLGWAFGGMLVAFLGVGWAIAIDAATFAVSATLLSAIGPVPAASTDEERAPFLRELADGWRALTSRRWLWATIVYFTLFLLVYEAPMQVLGPLVMEDSYDGARSWGFALAALGAGAAIGALLTTWSRVRRPILVSLAAFFLTAITPILMLVEAPLAVIIACNLVIGMSFGLFDTIWHSTLQHEIPPEQVSRVSAWDWMGSLAGMPIGFALAGVLAEAIGRDATLVGISATAFLLCIALIVDPAVRSVGTALPASDRQE